MNGAGGLLPSPLPPPSLWFSLSLFLLWHLFVTQLSPSLFSFWGTAESCELLTPLASLGFSISSLSSAMTCGVRLGVLDGQVVPC